MKSKRDRTKSPCSKCRGEKAGFNHAYCRPCFAAWCRERLARSAEARKSASDAGKKWREANPEKVAAKNEAWCKANPEKVKATQKRWYEKHGKEYRDRPGVREKVRASDRAGKKRKYHANPEAARAKQRAVHAGRKEYDNAYKRQYRIDHPAFVRLQDQLRSQRDWMKRHLGNQRLRAKRLGADGSHTVAEWKSVLRHYGRRCFYCKKELSNRTISKDHKIPLTRGGTDSIRNIVPSCKRCNSRKHTKTTEEFLEMLAHDNVSRLGSYSPEYSLRLPT